MIRALLIFSPTEPLHNKTSMFAPSLCNLIWIKSLVAVMTFVSTPLCFLILFLGHTLRHLFLLIMTSSLFEWSERDTTIKKKVEEGGDKYKRTLREMGGGVKAGRVVLDKFSLVNFRSVRNYWARCPLTLRRNTRGEDLILFYKSKFWVPLHVKGVCCCNIKVVKYVWELRRLD